MIIEAVCKPEIFPFDIEYFFKCQPKLNKYRTEFLSALNWTDIWYVTPCILI